MEKSEKPIKEWLKELPEPIRELAIKNTEGSHWKMQDVKLPRLSGVLGSSFDWRLTEEGTDFWEQWHLFIDRNTDPNGVFTDPKDYSGLPMPEYSPYANSAYDGTDRVEIKYEAPTWILITEKTPANNQKVLVCWSHTPVWEPSQAYYVDGQFYPERGAAPYFRVTHWMEMPKGVTE